MSPITANRVVVLYGGRSAEHDVSRHSAVNVARALLAAGFSVEAVGITADNGKWFRNDEPLGDQTALAVRGTPVVPTDIFDGDAVVAFPVLHGPNGEDGTVQGLLEVIGVPYVGSGVLGSALAMDKSVAKIVTANAGIPQARFLAYRGSDGDVTAFADHAVAELGLPLFAKPANMGSSVGVSKATTHDEVLAALRLALRYDEVVLLEEAVVGREIEVAVLGLTAPAASVPGEIRVGADFYDYEDKYLSGAAELVIPAALSSADARAVRELAVAAFRALRCAGLARVDFFYEEGGRGWLLNEVNTLPGVTNSSMYTKLWEATGVPTPELVTRLVQFAVERHTARARFSTDH